MPALELPAFEFARTWIPDLIARLRKARSQRMIELNQIGDSFGDPEELAKYYVEPDCQQFNPADFDTELSTVVREPIFSRLRTFISASAPQGPNALLLLSDAGMGKTSALVMLKLTHLMSFWPQTYECALLKLGPDSIDSIRAITSKRKTVLLLDALDEDSLAWNSVETRLKELLFESAQFKRVILTCRTQFFSGGTDPFHQRGKTQIGGFRCAVIYNSFLSDTQVVQYINKRAQEYNDPDAWKSRAIGIVEQIGYLRMRPMLLAHLDDIVSSQEQVWNEYSLYAALLESWLLREQRKAFGRENEYPDIGEMYRACQHLALYMQRTMLSQISEEDLRDNSPIYSPLSTLFAKNLSGRSLVNRTSEGAIRFSHFSVQEFLVTTYILDGGKIDFKNINCTDQMSSFAKTWASNRPNRHIANSDFSFFAFAGINLQGFHLECINLRSSDLSQSNFSKATIVESDFSGTSLTKTDFSAAQIFNSNFSGARLIGVDFRSAAINRSNLEHCNFQGADLSNTYIFNSSLKGAVFDSDTIFPHGLDPIVVGMRRVQSPREVAATKKARDKLDFQSKE